MTVYITLPYSTLAMRSAGGIDVIKKAVEQLSKYHDRHIRLYDPMLVSIPVHLIRAHTYNIFARRNFSPISPPALIGEIFIKLNFFLC